MRRSRRSLLRTAGVALLGFGAAGCLADTSRGVTDVVVRNDAPSERTVTVSFLDCSLSGEAERTVTVPADGEKTLNNVVVMESGTCELRVDVQDGPAKTHEWAVGRSTLRVTLSAAAVSFERQSG